MECSSTTERTKRELNREPQQEKLLVNPAVRQTLHFSAPRNLVNIKSSLQLRHVPRRTLDLLCRRTSQDFSVRKRCNFYVLRARNSSLTITLFERRASTSTWHANLTGHRDLSTLDHHHSRLSTFLQLSQDKPQLSPALESHWIDSLTSRVSLPQEANLIHLFHKARSSELSAAFNPKVFSGLVLRHPQLKTAVVHRRCLLFFGQKDLADVRRFLQLLEIKWSLF